MSSFPTFGGSSLTGPVGVALGSSATQQLANDQTTLAQINASSLALLNGTSTSSVQSSIGSYNSSLPATPASATTSMNSTFNNILNTLNPFSTASGLSTITGATPSSGSSISLFSISIDQVVAVVLGLIFIAGGIYLFKPAQQIINKAVKTGPVL